MPQLALAHERIRATLLPESGGRILQIEVRRHDDWLPILAAPSDPAAIAAEPLLWGCYPMAPWPGRVDRAAFDWRGQRYTLPPGDGPHAIHGLGAFLPWHVTTTDASSCVLERTLTPADGWPFPALLRHTVRLRPSSLALRLEVHARGAPFPAGVGWHPWFRRDVVPGATPRVLVDASRRYATRPDLIPTGEAQPPAGEADLRAGPPLAGRRLDAVYGGVTSPMRISWGDISLEIAASPNCAHAVVYTASDRGFCVEPQTCIPDAFNLAARGFAGTGLQTVTPTEPLVARTVWTFSSGQA